MYTIGERIIDKILSGRFIFTIIAALAFYTLSVNDLLDKKDVVYIITLIVVFYFNRNDRSNLPTVENNPNNVNTVNTDPMKTVDTTVNKNNT